MERIVRAEPIRHGSKGSSRRCDVDRRMRTTSIRCCLVVPKGTETTRRRILSVSLIPSLLLGLPSMARSETKDRDFGSDEGLYEAVSVVYEARNVAGRLQKVAETPFDSEERRRLRSQLPAYLRRVRRLSEAVPVCTKIAYGDSIDNGGPAGEVVGTESYLKLGQPSVELFNRVGKLITWGGTLAPEVLEDPSVAEEAKLALQKLLDDLPGEVTEGGAKKFFERNGFQPEATIR